MDRRSFMMSASAVALISTLPAEVVAVEGQSFTLDLIDQAVERSSNHLIRPIEIDGEEYYVAFVPPGLEEFDYFRRLTPSEFERWVLPALPDRWTPPATPMLFAD